MWPKQYKDYPKDSQLKKERVASGEGIIGCEMHELNGWGDTYHHSTPPKKGVIYSLLKKIFGIEKE